MSRIKGISIELDFKSTGLDKVFADVDKQSKNINKELRDINKLLKFNPKDTELLTQKHKVLSDQIKTTRERLNELKAAEAEVKRQFESGEIGEEQYRAFQREIIETESKLKHYEKQLRETSGAHLALAKNLEEAGEKVSKFGKGMEGVGKSLTKKVTTPLIGVGAGAAALGIGFEKSMSEVQAVTGATAEEMASLEKAARDAGATTDKSARDAADALQYMGLAGWSVHDSQEALMPMLKLSSAANMELGRTSDLVTDTMSALGLEINDLDHYLDVLAQASRNSNTNVDQLGQGFLTVGGKLRQLGVPLEEGATALGILANNGLKGSEAGRGLNAILTNMTAPVGRAADAIEELGLEFFDAEGNFIGVEAALKEVEEATKDMTMEQENMYLSMLAGKEHGKTLSALMNGLGGDFTELANDIALADGALDDMYDTATDNTMGAINNLKSAVEELGLKIFDNLQPAIESAVEWVQKVTDKFNELSPETQENIVKIGLLVAAIGPLLVILGKVTQGVGGVISIGGKLVSNWGNIQAVGTMVAKGVGASIGFLFSPAGMIMLGIAAVIAIGVALYKNWDTIKEKAAALASAVSEKFNAIKQNISDKINAAKDAVKNAIDKIKGFFDFSWSLPRLKLPRISIEGSFSLAPPRVPRFSINWNKAGGIFKNPTVLPTLAGLQGFAEPSTGGEAIMPLNKLPSLMAEAMGMNGRQGDIIVQHMHVRDETDIKKIARELHNLQQGRQRGRGIAYGV